MNFWNAWFLLRMIYAIGSSQIGFDIMHSWGLLMLKQNNLSLVICVVVSLSLGWQKDHLSHSKRSDIVIQYTRLRLFCFYILLFNGFKSFQVKIYEIHIYLLLYLIFFNHSVGIHPTATQKSHEQYSNAIHVTSWWLMTS